MIRKFRVTYYLRNGYKAKDGKVAVIVRINLNGERLIIGSAGFNVDPEKWVTLYSNKSCLSKPRQQ